MTNDYNKEEKKFLMTTAASIKAANLHDTKVDADICFKTAIKILERGKQLGFSPFDPPAKRGANKKPGHYEALPDFHREQFDQLRNLWGVHKAPLQKSAKAFSEIEENITIDFMTKLLEAVRAYKRYLGDTTQMHLSTFLNGRMWNDYAVNKKVKTTKHNNELESLFSEIRSLETLSKNDTSGTLQKQLEDKQARYFEITGKPWGES